MLLDAFRFHRRNAALRESVTPKPNRQEEIGAGNEIRTHDPNLGKVVLYH